MQFSHKRNSLHCLSGQRYIQKLFPYLNTDLGANACSDNPSFVTFKVYDKLITVHPDKIAINALKDQEEAKKSS